MGGEGGHLGELDTAFPSDELCEYIFGGGASNVCRLVFCEL